MLSIEHRDKTILEIRRIKVEDYLLVIEFKTRKTAYRIGIANRFTAKYTGIPYAFASFPLLAKLRWAVEYFMYYYKEADYLHCRIFCFAFGYRGREV